MRGLRGKQSGSAQRPPVRKVGGPWEAWIPPGTGWLPAPLTQASRKGAPAPAPSDKPNGLTKEVAPKRRAGNRVQHGSSPQTRRGWLRSQLAEDEQELVDLVDPEHGRVTQRAQVVVIP